jgi:recombination directionality factor gp3-like protein
MNTTYGYSMPGLLYTPVELGTIRLGHLEERGDRQTPVKDDKFRITRLVKQRNGGWIDHPLQQVLLDKLPPPAAGDGAVERKLRAIPIRIMYDAPDLTVRSRYEAFDVQKKRPVCASTTAGQARRLGQDGVSNVACAGPEQCGFANEAGVRCKLFGRLTVQIEGQQETDNGFVLRSTSVNTLRNVEARLVRYWAMFGRRLTGIPFQLVLRAKTTAGSHWSPFFFVDLELGAGVTLQKAAQLAQEHAKANEQAGLDTVAWEAAVRAGLDNGALAAGDIEAELMTEFFADAEQGEDGQEREAVKTPKTATSSALADVAQALAPALKQQPAPEHAPSGGQAAAARGPTVNSDAPDARTDAADAAADAANATARPSSNTVGARRSPRNQLPPVRTATLAPRALPRSGFSQMPPKPIPRTPRENTLPSTASNAGTTPTD